MSIGEWLKERSQKLIILFLVIQTIIFIFFTIIFFIVTPTEYKTKDEIYVCLILALFLGFMIHFAYHSIHYAYFVELIAFLIMSVMSSILTCFNFFKYVILRENNLIYEIIGVVSVIILILGNIVYLIAAYYSYELFEEKYISKLGAKEIHHSIL